MNKTRRIISWLTIVIVFGGAYLWLFGVSTGVCLETWYIGRKSPAVRRMPIELQDLSLGPSTGRKIAVNGYEFELPWNDVDEDRCKTIGNRRVIAFLSGNAILVMFPTQNEFVNGVLKSGFDRETFRSIYGDGPLESDYAMYKLMLESAPQRVSPLSNKKFAIGQAMMIVMKAISMPSGADTGLYSVSSNGFHGFQYGDPGKRPKHITIDLLDDKGGIEFGIFQKTDAAAQAVTQPQINRMLQSVRKIEAVSPGTGD